MLIPRFSLGQTQIRDGLESCMERDPFLPIIDNNNNNNIFFFISTSFLSFTGAETIFHCWLVCLNCEGNMKKKYRGI